MNDNLYFQDHVKPFCDIKCKLCVLPSSIMKMTCANQLMAVGQSATETSQFKSHRLTKCQVIIYHLMKDNH